MFIRFGNLKGKSNIFRYGELVGNEIGLSVYYCDEENCINIPLNTITDTTLDTISILYFNAFGFVDSHIPIYKIKGDIIGYGTDGEPLLTNTKIIEKLKTSIYKKYDYFLEGYNDTIYPYRNNMLIIPLYSKYLQNNGIYIKSYTPIKCNYKIVQGGRFKKY
jgi:hypothetical protein